MNLKKVYFPLKTHLLNIRCGLMFKYPCYIRSKRYFKFMQIITKVNRNMFHYLTTDLAAVSGGHPPLVPG